MSLSTTSLPIGEACNHTVPLKHQGKYWLQGCVINGVRGILVRVGIVEVEVVIFNDLSDAINLMLTLMDTHEWVSRRDRVNLPCRLFLGEDGSFSNTYCDLQGGVRLMSTCLMRVKSLSLDHHVKFRINVLTLSLII